MRDARDRATWMSLPDEVPISPSTASEEESGRGRPAQLLPSTKTFAFQMQIRRCRGVCRGWEGGNIP